MNWLASSFQISTNEKILFIVSNHEIKIMIGIGFIQNWFNWDTIYQMRMVRFQHSLCCPTNKTEMIIIWNSSVWSNRMKKNDNRNGKDVNKLVRDHTVLFLYNLFIFILSTIKMDFNCHHNNTSSNNSVIGLCQTKEYPKM